MFKRSLILIV